MRQWPKTVFAGAILPLLSAATAQVTDVGLPLGNEADPYAPAVSRMVRSIISYSNWPQGKQKITICIVGPTDHVGDLVSDARRTRGRIATRTAGPTSLAGCDLVYLGRIALADQRMVTDALRGKPVLTISENDPACRSRSMICLLFQADSLSFRLNLDAVSRSQVRIDPRVLRLGEGEPT